MWALPFLFLGLFFYYPIAQVVERALVQDNAWTLSKINDVLSSPHLISVISFTINQALLSAALSLLIGTALAYLLSNYRFTGRKLLKSLTIVPFALPPITVALGFVLVYGEQGLLMNSIMSIFSLDEPPIQILYSLQGIVLAHAFYNAPIVARFVSAAWERVPRKYTESASSLGASKLRQFIDIELPLLLPSILSGTLIAFIFSFLSFPVVLALGGSRFATIEVEIYLKALGGFIDYSGAAALALITLLISLFFVFVFLRVERSHRITTGARALHTLKGILLKTRIYLLISIFVVFFLGPLLALIWDSITARTADGLHLTSEWFQAVLSPAYSANVSASPLSSVLNSFGFAMASMLIALGLGIVVSLLLSKSRWKLLEMAAMMPIAISPVVLGLSYLWFFSRPPVALRGTWIAIVIVHAIIAMPFVIRAIRPALSQFDWRLTEAARSLGANNWRSTWEITLPLLKGSIAAGAIFAFAISMAEMSATIMLIGPELVTMPLSVYYLFGSRQFGAASAMSVLMIAVLAISFFGLDRLSERASSRRGLS